VTAALLKHCQLLNQGHRTRRKHQDKALWNSQTNQAHWKSVLVATFLYLIFVNCPVSGAKSLFNVATIYNTGCTARIEEMSW